MEISNNKIKLNTIPSAIEAIKNGEIVIVVDDENRENEGDFVAAADKVSPEMINFMATQGRGLICAPITESRCEELNLDLMVGLNTVPVRYSLQESYFVERKLLHRKKVILILIENNSTG